MLDALGKPVHLRRITSYYGKVMTYSAGIFYRLEDNRIAATTIQRIDLSPTEVCEFVPQVLPAHGIPVAEDTIFKAFWFGSDKWISDVKDEATPKRGRRVLILVDQTLNHLFQEGEATIATWTKVAKITPAFKDLLPKPWWRRIFGAVETKPRVGTFGVDLRKLSDESKGK